ncbi:MAG: hypothetical protein ABIO30_07280, partial [Thermomonas sp.]
MSKTTLCLCQPEQRPAVARIGLQILPVHVCRSRRIARLQQCGTQIGAGWQRPVRRFVIGQRILGGNSFARMASACLVFPCTRSSSPRSNRSPTRS